MPWADTGERIVIFGRNIKYEITQSSTLELLCGIVDSPHRIVGMIATDEAAEELPSLRKIAESFNVPTWSFPKNDVNSPEAMALLRSLQPTLFVVIQFPKIFLPGLIGLSSKGALNVHRGWPLRGGSIDQRAILGGLREYNVILHRIVPRVDAGDILARETVHLDPNVETGYSLDSRTSIAGVRLIRFGLLPLLGKPLPEGLQQNLEETSYENKWSGERKIVIVEESTFSTAEKLARALYHPRENGLYLRIGNKIYLWQIGSRQTSKLKLERTAWRDGVRHLPLLETNF